MNLAAGSNLVRKMILKDGREVDIRPISLDDLDAACEFFAGMPEEDKAYLRFDVNDRRVIEERLKEIQEWGRLKRVVACEGGRIVGTGVLELKDSEREFDLAEVRLIVGREMQRKGLGRLIARELFLMAAKEKIRELRARVLRPQEAALSILRRLGFHEIELLEDAAVDRYGKRQDVILLSCSLEDLWKEMELQVENFDIQHR